MDDPIEGDPRPAGPTLRDVAGFFLKLGVLAFGGPAAHVALMEDELVRRRRWLSREAFLDLLAVSNLLPGPSSTELAIFIGYRLRGFPGLLLAGACFICPAFLMVGALAWAYVRYGSLPATAGLLYGVKPVVIAIVAQALWRLAGSAVKTPGLAVLGLLALVASFAGVPPLAVLASAGVLAVRAAKVAGLYVADHRWRWLHSRLPPPWADRRLSLRSAAPVSSSHSSNSVASCSAAGTCCWPSSNPTWWKGDIGSRPRN